MVFAPKLEGGVAYNQPVQQPNAMEAIAGLFDFGIDTLTKQNANKPKLTEDEGFALAFRKFEEDMGGGFEWGDKTTDRKAWRQFIFNYPQYASQAKAMAETMGTTFSSPEQVAEEATLEWFKTKEGILALAASQDMPEGEKEAFLSEQYTKVLAQEAKIAELERNSAQYAAEGTLLEKQWDVLKPTSKDMVDHTVSTIISPIFEQVRTGTTIEVDPELKAQFNLRYDTISINNIDLFLQDVKSALSVEMRNKYSSQFGADALPSDIWNSSVFEKLDGLIKISEQFDSPQEKAAALDGIIKSRFIEVLDKNNLTLALKLFETLPPEVTNQMLEKIPGMVSKVSDVLVQDGAILTTKGIAQKVADGSKADAEQIATDVIQFFDKGFVPELFILFKEAADKSGFKVVDGASHRTIIGNNVEEIKRLSATNPEIRLEITKFLTSDIQQTISVINSNLVAGVKAEFDGKKFILVPEAGTLAAQKWNDSYRPYSQFALDQLPEGMNLDTLNEKIATLGLLGDVGAEVQDAIGILNQAEGGSSTRDTNRGRGRSRSSSSSSSSEGDIGTKLGIDFAKYESEAGLPAGYLNKIAMIESGGNPNADNPNSSAGGLFQQIDSNAAAYGVTDRFDPVQSTEGAVRFAVDNKNYLMGILGREPTGGELYLAHQQGPAGAARLLANPDAKAVDIVGVDAIKLNGGNVNMTAGEFANIWISKYNGSRGQMTGSYSAAQNAPTVSVDSSAGEIPERVQGSSTASTESLQTNLISYDSPEVQQIVEMAQSKPEEALRVAKEILAGKPIDPSIKALIEALVRIGEKA